MAALYFRQRLFYWFDFCVVRKIVLTLRSVRYTVVVPDNLNHS